jgi:hypothetical protein
MRELKNRMEQFILDGSNSVKLIELLQEENKSLRKQNELLFNKLMSRNFEEYAVYKSEQEDLFVPNKVDPYTNDDLAGDIIDETEQSDNSKPI